jgi:hypothetical protein
VLRACAGRVNEKTQRDWHAKQETEKVFSDLHENSLISFEVRERKSAVTGREPATASN